VTLTREVAIAIVIVLGLAVNQANMLIYPGLECRRRNGLRTTRALRPLQALRLAKASGRTVVLTSTTLLASVLPLVLGTSTPDLFRMIGLGAIGGICASVVGTLLIAPVLLSSDYLPARSPSIRSPA